MPNLSIPYTLAFVLALVHVSCKNISSGENKAHDGWANYAGAKDGNRYSSIDQLDTANVGRLRVAWTYSTHDKDTGNRSQNQCNPVIIDGMLYGTSPRSKLFALDAATGKQIWIFDPALMDTSSAMDGNAFFKLCRGVAYWRSEDGNEKRIFYSSGPKTYAIDAATGKPIRSFGKGGYIDLSEDLDRAGGFNPFVAGTTPGIIYKDLLIIGMRTAESPDAAPGHIRAYDVRTGKRRWIFHTIPHPGERGYDTWDDKDAWKKFGGANNWAGMALDEARGIVYVPTGSVGGDFYGADRKGQNLFANSLLALDAATGEYRWHFQIVHHDLWDRDLAANPNLVSVEVDGKKIDAVAQITKHGYVFLFDRISGKPVFPIVETPVPTEGLPSEQPWPTQPIPSLPEPFARQRFEPADVSDRNPEVHRELMERYHKIKHRTPFSPPSKEGGWMFPGFDGGGEWGGAAVDLETKIMYVNSSELPWEQVMIEVPATKADAGATVYNKFCISCHGPGLKGNGSSIPSLVDVFSRHKEDAIRQTIQSGRNMMPAFSQIQKEEMQALLRFLKSPKQTPVAGSHSKEPGSSDGSAYAMKGYTRFLDKDGYPGIKPPWGTLNAVNLETGKLLWKVPLGAYDELTKQGMPPTGTENYGGPVVTKGGLVFIAATKDEKIRAFDKKSGAVLWEAKLPAAGYATPATYIANGKQYIVIACGGGKSGTKSGDMWVAFALP
ncbi:outer membrane protein assembly factor BamB family protein [Chitinophaga lutea]